MQRWRDESISLRIDFHQIRNKHMSYFTKRVDYDWRNILKIDSLFCQMPSIEELLNGAYVLHAIWVRNSPGGFIQHGFSRISLNITVQILYVQSCLICYFNQKLCAKNNIYGVSSSTIKINENWSEHHNTI